MLRTKLTFTGSAGDELAARLDLPLGEPRAFALFAHCFTCGKDIAAASRISAGLVDAGIAVLRFDFTGLGSSEGEFANTSFTSNVADLVLAAGVLRDRHLAPALVVGHSLGGAAVLAAAAEIPEVRAVATIGAPADVAHTLGLFAPADRARIEAEGEAEVTLAGRPFRIGKQLLDDLSANRLEGVVGGLRRALLVLHSPVDEIVGIDHARRLHDAARHPKSFVSLDGADHLLTNRRDAAFAAGIISAWAGRYLDEVEVPVVASPTPPPPGVVVVETAERGLFTQRVLAGTHAFVADEPIGVGDDEGPNPYELVLAGLGACTSMTLQMYARRKGMALRAVRVELTHTRAHAADCEGLTETCRIARLDRTITLEGDLSDAEQADLLRIADRCPVHRTLEGRIEITTALAPVTT